RVVRVHPRVGIGWTRKTRPDVLIDIRCPGRLVVGRGERSAVETKRRGIAQADAGWWRGHAFPDGRRIGAIDRVGRQGREVLPLDTLAQRWFDEERLATLLAEALRARLGTVQGDFHNELFLDPVELQGPGHRDRLGLSAAPGVERNGLISTRDRRL